jgi:hypothetical protein
MNCAIILTREIAFGDDKIKEKAQIVRELIMKEYARLNTYPGFAKTPPPIVHLVNTFQDGRLGECARRGDIRIAVSGCACAMPTTIRHELGHHFHLSLPPFIRREWDLLMPNNTVERFAESFATYTHERYGKTTPRLNEHVENFMRRQLGA